jgi:hypothetical protein
VGERWGTEGSADENSSPRNVRLDAEFEALKAKSALPSKADIVRTSVGLPARASERKVIFT